MELGDRALPWADVLEALLAGHDLDADTAAAALADIMRGETDPAVVAGFLVALRAKGETAAEITGLARTMRDFSLAVPAAPPLLDTCGTGGDRSGTANVSTLAALVAAACGARVAKHGNRAASSRCGSADLLEALGVVIEIGPDPVAACIEEAGIGFCFAPVFHPAMRHVGPVRRALGIRTVFNVLGPLANPARAEYQLVGVPDPGLAPKMAAALGALGSRRAWVVHGAHGLDELSPTGPNRVWVLDGGVVTETVVDPADLGIAAAHPEDLAGGDAAENAALSRRVLDGETGPVRDVVALNAAGALVVAALARDLPAGLRMAFEALDSGAAAAKLEALVRVSQAQAGSQP